jgi:hypothetical protein
MKKYKTDLNALLPIYFWFAKKLHDLKNTLHDEKKNFVFGKKMFLVKSVSPTLKPAYGFFKSFKIFFSHETYFFISRRIEFIVIQSTFLSHAKK